MREQHHDRRRERERAGPEIGDEERTGNAGFRVIPHECEVKRRGEQHDADHLQPGKGIDAEQARERRRPDPSGEERTRGPGQHCVLARKPHGTDAGREREQRDHRPGNRPSGKEVPDRRRG